jgi:type II secretory pathway component PulF
MSTFYYRGITDDGTVVEGHVRGGVRQDAYRAMEYRGLRPLRVQEFPEARTSRAERVVVGRTTVIVGVNE